MTGGSSPDKIFSLTNDARSDAPGHGPRELTRLLDAPDAARQDHAWDAFLDAFGHLLLKTAHYTHRNHDGAMDAYAHVLERLREDCFRRLRTFSGGDGEALSRWLVVVARRMCLDFRRERYGRPRASVPPIEKAARRRLVDEIWDAREPSSLPGPTSASPEWQLRCAERRRTLEAVLEELSPRDQLLLSLRFDDDLSARQIAEFMGWATPFHVYRRLNKLLPKLRERLKAMGIEGSTP